MKRVALVTCAVVLLAACGDVTVEQHIVQPGDIYPVEGHGNLGRKDVPSLVCRYRFGGVERVRIYDYDAAAARGLASCPETFADVREVGGTPP